MVDQLTQINSLQQLIQIQSDLQTLLRGAGFADNSSNSSSSSGTGVLKFR